MDEMVLISGDARVPDRFIDKTYQCTKQEVEIRTKGSLPYVTLSDPFHALQT